MEGKREFVQVAPTFRDLQSPYLKDLNQPRDNLLLQVLRQPVKTIGSEAFITAFKKFKLFRLSAIYVHKQNGTTKPRYNHSPKTRTSLVSEEILKAFPFGQEGTNLKPTARTFFHTVIVQHSKIKARVLIHDIFKTLIYFTKCAEHRTRQVFKRTTVQHIFFIIT